jgi:murein DD-endopeptidase MepM/ murein hydrolase activator NlpD
LYHTNYDRTKRKSSCTYTASHTRPHTTGDGGILSSYKNKANYIIIKHSDGCYGCYWHLQKNGVLVKTGVVAKGQQIAVSGATGQVLSPHLHFSVKRQLNYKKDSFIKSTFYTTNGILLLKTGQAYERPKE